MVTASVRDSGVGISQENLSRIFEPFFSTKSMGTGLGLSISYGLIKEHKGTLEVESQEARGTCFTVRLPKISEESMGYSLLVG
jgi:two-component system NtrC family sensor kinase